MVIKTTFNSDLKMLKKRNLESGGKVQQTVDSEVLRRCDPYVPFRTGFLKKSGILGTKIGSGLVVYNAPYAKTQYKYNAGRGKQGFTKQNAHNYKCLRGKLWFPRMMVDHKADIIKTANEAAGGSK